MKGSNPKVISKTVQKIINARKPKTRYVAGQGGKFLIALRNIFGDRVYDALMYSQMK